MADETPKEQETLDKRLEKTAKWTDEASTRMENSAANMGNIAMELLGPESRSHLLDYHNGVDADGKHAGKHLYKRPGGNGG